MNLILFLALFVALIASECHKKHLVSPTDTLETISQKYGVLVETIAELNPGLSVAPGVKICLPSNPARCDDCNAKMPLAARYKCRCGGVYCTKHRYFNSHECSYDWKADGRGQIEKANPIVVADRVPDRI